MSENRQRPRLVPQPAMSSRAPAASEATSTSFLGGCRDGDVYETRRTAARPDLPPV